MPFIKEAPFSSCNIVFTIGANAFIQSICTGIKDLSPGDDLEPINSKSCWN